MHRLGASAANLAEGKMFPTPGINIQIKVELVHFVEYLSAMNRCIVAMYFLRYNTILQIHMC